MFFSRRLRVNLFQATDVYSVYSNSLVTSVPDSSRIKSEPVEQVGEPSVTQSNNELDDDNQVGVYATNKIKQFGSEGKLTTKQRGVWLIRRHSEMVEKFCQSPKQVLGLSSQEYKKRVNLLQQFEINEEDALVIALTYPSCLTLDSSSMYEMVALLNEFGCYLPKHFMKNPYVFSLDAKQCYPNLERLKQIGLSKESIGSLIDTNPIVLTVSLTKEVDRFAENAKNYQSSSNILRLALKSSLLKPGEKVCQNEDLEHIVSFLHELKVDLSKLMQKCPEFLCTSYNNLFETYKFLSGPPLYCEKNHVKKLLTSNPHAFLQMNRSTCHQSIQSLSKIVESNVKLYLLLRKSPMLFVESSPILLERIELLKNYKFTQKEILSLLEKAAFVFSDEKSSSSLEKKLHLLLSKNDITTSQVCNSAFILRAPLDKIQKRLFFIRYQNPDVLQKYSLNEIIFSNNQVFISDICNSSLKRYLDTVELAGP